MSETVEAVEAARPVRRRMVAQHWWDWQPTHPMTDEEFLAAFTAWVFAHSEDYSIRGVRNRVGYFVRHFLAPEIARDLLLYRVEHPLP